jgi:hypothetical protein
MALSVVVLGVGFDTNTDEPKAMYCGQDFDRPKPICHGLFKTTQAAILATFSNIRNQLLYFARTRWVILVQLRSIVGRPGRSLAFLNVPSLPDPISGLIFISYRTPPRRPPQSGAKEQLVAAEGF